MNLCAVKWGQPVGKGWASGRFRHSFGPTASAWSPLGLVDSGIMLASVVSTPIGAFSLFAPPFAVLFGFPLALLQWLVMRLHALPIAGWLWATFAGWWIAWVVGFSVLAFGLFGPMYVRPWSLVIPCVAAIVGGAALGMSQARVLESNRTAHEWVLASAAGALLWVLAFNFLADAGCGRGQFFCNWLPAALVGGSAYGLVTGITLARLLALGSVRQAGPRSEHETGVTEKDSEMGH